MWIFSFEEETQPKIMNDGDVSDSQLTAFAFALLDLGLISHIFVTSFAEVERPKNETPWKQIHTLLETECC